jgi:hypothetical protein
MAVAMTALMRENTTIKHVNRYLRILWMSLTEEKDIIYNAISVHGPHEGILASLADCECSLISLRIDNQREFTCSGGLYSHPTDHPAVVEEEEHPANAHEGVSSRNEASIKARDWKDAD